MPATSPFCVRDTTSVCERLDLLDRLADEGAQDPVVADLAMRVGAKVGRADPRALAAEALVAVQTHPYVPNPPGQDCYQPARWTHLHGGECKALTVLYVALCRKLGVEAEPVWVNQEGAPLNHVVAMVRAAGQSYWADPSLKGAYFGESPYEAVPRLDAWHVIGARPAGGAFVFQGRRSPRPAGQTLESSLGSVALGTTGTYGLRVNSRDPACANLQPSWVDEPAEARAWNDAHPTCPVPVPTRPPLEGRIGASTAVQTAGPVTATSNLSPVPQDTSGAPDALCATRPARPATRAEGELWNAAHPSCPYDLDALFPRRSWVLPVAVVGAAGAAGFLGWYFWLRK